MRTQPTSAARSRKQHAASCYREIDATHLHLKTQGETVIAQALAARGPAVRIQVEQSADFIERARKVLGFSLIDERVGSVSDEAR